MTPFRASWSGSPLAAWSSRHPHKLGCKQKRMRALRELCQAEPQLCNAQSDAAWAAHQVGQKRATWRHMDAEATPRDDELLMHRLDDKTRAADMISQLAAQTAAQLGLHEGLRWAADCRCAAASRIWTGRARRCLPRHGLWHLPGHGP